MISDCHCKLPFSNQLGFAWGTGCGGLPFRSVPMRGNLLVRRSMVAGRFSQDGSTCRGRSSVLIEPFILGFGRRSAF